MDTILVGLNEAQRSAVTSPASVLQILAPPGSGKTKTLTSRVAYLLSHQQCKPWNIICLTFTIKSAREMKERISKLIGSGLETKLVLGTFHSVCRRYLVTYGHLIGVRKGFGIADSSDTVSIITRIVKRLKLNLDPKVARSRISSSKARGIGYAELGLDITKKRNVDQQEFVTVFEAYEDHLFASNLLDYDDLLLRCVDLLRQHPACVSNVEAVLIDEFQDTNLVQFDLMRLFAVKNKCITTVGDPDQSIYGWRSAEIKNLRRMQKQYPDTLAIHLEDNYRSSGAILLAALEVIQQDDSRPQKPLLPTHCPGTIPVLRRLPSAAIEASWIVSEIQRTMALTGSLLDYSDFAVLLRSASLSRHIESVMGKIGIPYRMVGGYRFFDRVEVKILLDYLRVVSQPNNSDALGRILNVPSRRIGDTTIKTLVEDADKKKLSLWDLLRAIRQGRITSNVKISKATEHSIGSLMNIIQVARNKLLDTKNPYSPKQILEFVLKKLEFQSYLEKTYPEDHEARWANVEELQAQASDVSVDGLKNGIEALDASEESLPRIDGIAQEVSNIGEEALSRFLANVALSTEIQRDDETNDEGISQERVTISTIHAAKGLEWPVVFIPSAYEGSIPHSRAEDTDEERRLLYVAMTRAQALLYMSCPKRNSMREETTLSPFLSSRKVASYLTNKAPSIGSSVLQDISRILRRDYPSEQSMRKAFETVKNLEDVLWPLDGEEDPKAIETKWNKPDADGSTAYNYRFMTTGNVLHAQGYHTTNTAATHLSTSMNSKSTLLNRSSYTINSQQSGFITAGSHMRYLKFETDRGEKRPRCSVLTEKQQSDRSDRKKHKKVAIGQGSLVELWGGNNDKSTTSLSGPPGSGFPHTFEDDEGSTGKDEAFQNRVSTVHASLPRPIIPIVIPGEELNSESRKRGSPIPQQLANHALRPLLNTNYLRPLRGVHNDTNKAYVFLSSSPPPCGNEFEEMQAREAPPYIINSKENHVETNSRLSDIRPSSTYHTTSVAQVRATDTAPRKTLGVRRTMVGWSARGNHRKVQPNNTRLG